MRLRSAVENLTFAARPLLPQGATARLAAGLPPAEPVVRPPIDLNAVARRFVDDVLQGEAPSGADWNKIAWCLWTTTPAVAQHDRALGAVLDRVAETIRLERKRAYRQLASAYLLDFAVDRPQIERIGGVLGSLAPAAGGPWDRLQAQYAVFDGVEAAAHIARCALDAQINVHGVLTAAGVSGPLVDGGFARAAHDAGLDIIASTPVASAADHVATLRRWALRPDKRLIFETSKAAFARAVVGPYGGRMPAHAERFVVSNLLVGMFGDPRVNRGKWIGMDDVAQILRRWLTEQSLRQFLDVVDKIAPDRMWKYRRAFWQACHKADLLQNAWVIFGEDGAVAAMQAFGNSVRFAKFRPGGKKQILPGHAVLLLDFGPCIVADWSHNGRCNIWKKSDKTRPADLNAPVYRSDEVMRRLPKDDSETSLNKNDIFSHHGSENYVWQNRVAERLHELIGVRIPPTDYLVR